MKNLQERFAQVFPPPYARGFQAELAKICGVSAPTVTAWLNKPEKVASIDRVYAERICAAYKLGYSPAWLAEGLGDERMGSMLTIPPGSYMDGLANTVPGPAIRGKVPLISWVRAGELCESHDNYHPGDAEHYMDCPVPHGPRTYCLALSGDSMDDGSADAYRDGEIVFVDPDVRAEPGKDVVVRTPENKTTFKRLKQDSEGLYLLGLNGKKIVRVPEDTVFCGVVIFSGRRR